MDTSRQQPAEVRGPGDAGVSLLEVLVVLVIIAAAAAVVAPSLRRPTTAVETQLVARELAGHLRGARAAAIGRGQEVTVRFDAQKRQYDADDGGRVTTWPSHLTLRLTTARLERDQTDQAHVRFFPDGSSTGGSIDVAGDGRTTRITINWLTGTVSQEALP